MKKQAGGIPPLPFEPKLNNLKSSRQTFARLIKERGSGNIDDKTFRSLVWAMSQYLGFLKAENEEELEIRILALEKVLKND